jgi:putative ABC transport system permease protein
MLKLNLKIVLRNLWKNKVYTAINIFGLAAGLAGFMLILLYVNKETGYDQWDPVLKRSYMVAADFTQNGAVNKGSKIKALFAKVVKEQFPVVENISIGALNGQANLKYRLGDKELKEKLASVSMDDQFFKTYPLKAILGRMDDVFKGKNFIAISKTTAKKFFGNADPIDKVLVENKGLNAPESQLVVKAVWDDQQQPSYFDFHVFRPADFSAVGSEMLYRNFSTMLTLREGVDQDQVFAKINEVYLIELAKLVAKNSEVNFRPNHQQALDILRDKEGITAFKLIVEPVDNLNLGTFYSTSAKQQTLYILISLATFLIVISCINYTNLSLVLAQGRAKEVGIKKVFGAFKGNLIKQFFTEAAVQCVFAFLIALVIAELLLPIVNHLLSAQLSIFRSVDFLLVLGQVLFILIGIILLAGAYPAVVLAGFLPAKVLKGNFSTSKHIGSLRKVLVVFQFTIAIGLVISFLVMYAQLNFMKEKDLGLKPAQLMTLAMFKSEHQNLSPERFRAIEKRLLAINGVEAVTRATEQPINDSGFSDDLIYGDKTLMVEARYVDPNYLSVIGGKVTEGRDFAEQLIATDSISSILINEMAYRQLGLDRGVNQQITMKDDELAVKDDEKLRKYRVIGKVKDIQAYGFEQPVGPTIYLVADYQLHARRNIILRLSASHFAETVSEIKKVWMEIEPGKDPDYTFADESFAQMNATYEMSQRIIFYFGMLTLLVAVFGLVGAAAYSAKLRIKEVAVRKVLGASTGSLLKLLNRDFVILVVIANVLADVVAYVYMEKWFTGFAYRIDMPFDVFILANLVVLFITMFTVSWQSLKAVNSKPANVLKYE